MENADTDALDNSREKFQEYLPEQSSTFEGLLKLMFWPEKLYMHFSYFLSGDKGLRYIY